MSGIEVAGLVLGSFPILLNCLDYYRKGFEPLEEWWNFEAHFMAFTDGIRHQRMMYHVNIRALLDPIITNPSSLDELVQNATDPLWSEDGDLADILKKRLAASELDRFLRIVQRMEKEIRGLKKLLGIKDGNVRIQQDSQHPPDLFCTKSLFIKAHWAQPEQQQSWEWQLQRLRISFNMGKTKKVKKLETSNQELKEIIECSAQIMQMADKRKSSPPVAFFEKMFHHACAMHNALVRNWKCSSRTCRTHQANLCLRAETDIVGFNVLFVLENEQGAPLEPKKQEVMIKPAEDAESFSPNKQIGFVPYTESFTAIQANFENTNPRRKRSSFTKLVSKTLSSTQPVLPPENRIISAKGEKKARFAVPAVTISPDQAEKPEINPSANNNSPPQSIADLCSSLQNCPNSNLGIIVDESDRQFQLLRPVKSIPATVPPHTARLTPLPAILDASIDIDRHRRFEMAVHIASALLQIHTSPWLSSHWSKDQFYFLADTQHVYSDYPYVSQMFMPSVTDPPTTDNSLGNPPSTSVEETRTSLFTVGVIILELIFGRNIETCSFRSHYYGPDNQPNDQTDVSTARKWSQEVLGECGSEIADVVRRCLDCSFGPEPNLRDTRFKQAIYDGVIRPLADYLKAWQVTSPEDLR